MEFKFLPDLLSGDSVFVEFEVEEDCVFRHIRIRCNNSRSSRFVFCSNCCLKDKFVDGNPVPASLDEAMIQEANKVCKVFLVSFMSEIHLNQTIYCTFDVTWGVLGGGGNVQMQVHCLLVSFGDDLVIANSKSHVQEVNRGGKSDRFDVPF